MNVSGATKVKSPALIDPPSVVTIIGCGPGVLDDNGPAPADPKSWVLTAPTGVRVCCNGPESTNVLPEVGALSNKTVLLSEPKLAPGDPFVA